MIESERDDATAEVDKRGGILAAIRRSPLVDADLDLSRVHDDGRPLDDLFGPDDIE